MNRVALATIAAVSGVVGYLAGVEVGYRGGVRASARVFGVKPSALVDQIQSMRRSREGRNPRMGD
jgi:hypothetical protein